MKTHETPAEAAEGVSPEATIAEKLAWLETRNTALDARGIAVLNEVFPTFMSANDRRVRRRFLSGDIPLADVDDLLQETFWTLFYRAKDHGVKESLRKMLGQIAKGKFLNFLRDKSRAPVIVEMPESGSALPESSVDVDRAVYYRALAKRFVDDLSPDHQAVVKLAILGDATIAETAVALGLPEGTVSSRLRAARAALRALAEEALTPSERDAA